MSKVIIWYGIIFALFIILIREERLIKDKRSYRLFLWKDIIEWIELLWIKR